MAKNIVQLQNDIANNLADGDESGAVEVRSILNDMLDFAESLDTGFYGIIEIGQFPVITAADDGAWIIEKGIGIYEAQNGAWIIIFQSAPLLPNMRGRFELVVNMTGNIGGIRPLEGSLSMSINLQGDINTIQLAGNFTSGFNLVGDLTTV